VDKHAADTKFVSGKNGASKTPSVAPNKRPKTFRFVNRQPRLLLNERPGFLVYG
jgi:hypothetical protein